MIKTESPRVESAQASPGASLYGMYLLSLAAAGIGNLVIRIGARGGWLPAWAQIAVGIVAAGPLFFAAIFFWRMMRHDLDEMLQRVVLEGMAFALVVYVPLAALYVNLRTASAWTPRLDPPDILFAPALLVAVGIAIAYRRYQ